MTVVQTEQFVPLAGGQPLVSAQPPSEISVLLTAVERGAPVEAIERLVAMIQQQQDRAAAREFARCFAEFQAACPSVPKTTKKKIGVTTAGTGFDIAYAQLDEIAQTVGPHLHPLGFSYSWDERREENTLHVTCTLRHANGHSTQASFPSPIDASNRMGESHRISAALTYGQRRSLSAVLGLTSTEPDDDMEGSEEKINEEQSANLQALLDETKGNRDKLLALMGVAKMEDIRAGQYAQAVAALEQRRRQAQP